MSRIYVTCGTYCKLLAHTAFLVPVPHQSMFLLWCGRASCSTCVTSRLPAKRNLTKISRNLAKTSPMPTSCPYSTRTGRARYRLQMHSRPSRIHPIPSRLFVVGGGGVLSPNSFSVVVSTTSSSRKHHHHHRHRYYYYYSMMILSSSSLLRRNLLRPPLFARPEMTSRRRIPRPK